MFTVITTDPVACYQEPTSDINKTWIISYHTHNWMAAYHVWARKFSFSHTSLLFSILVYSTDFWFECYRALEWETYNPFIPFCATVETITPKVLWMTWLTSASGNSSLCHPQHREVIISLLQRKIWNSCYITRWTRFYRDKFSNINMTNTWEEIYLTKHLWLLRNVLEA